ncbi:MAG: LPXTG cell wall anchor domain-containing protein [Leuconostoc lactis]
MVVNNNGNNSPSVAVLPKTGDNSLDNTLTMVGGAAVIATAAGLLFKKRKEKGKFKKN